LSLTLWEDQLSAETYEKSGEYHKLLEQANPYLAESDEWTIQLSENLELEYLPVTEEPVLKEFSVTVQTKENIKDEESNKNLHVRIVSMTVAETKLKEYRELYKNEIIPALQKTKGCRFVFLTENHKKHNEVLSITIWDNVSSSKEYENSGGFSALFEKVEHTMSEQYKWKKAIDKMPGHYSLTTEDMRVSHYELVIGQVFND